MSISSNDEDDTDKLLDEVQSDKNETALGADRHQDASSHLRIAEGVAHEEKNTREEKVSVHANEVEEDEEKMTATKEEEEEEEKPATSTTNVQEQQLATTEAPSSPTTMSSKRTGGVVSDEAQATTDVNNVLLSREDHRSPHSGEQEPIEGSSTSSHPSFSGSTQHEESTRPIPIHLQPSTSTLQLTNTVPPVTSAKISPSMEHQTTSPVGLPSVAPSTTTTMPPIPTSVSLQQVSRPTSQPPTLPQQHQLPRTTSVITNSNNSAHPSSSWSSISSMTNQLVSSGLKDLKEDLSTITSLKGWFGSSKKDIVQKPTPSTLAPNLTPSLNLTPSTKDASLPPTSSSNNDRHHSSDKQVSMLISNLQEMTSKYQKLREEHDAVLDKIKAQASYDQVNNDLKAKIEEVIQLKTELSNYKFNFNRQREENIRLEEKRSKLEKQLKDSEKQLANMRKQTDLRWAFNLNDFAELKNELAKTKEKQTLLEKLLEERSTEKEQLLEELRTLKESGKAEADRIKKKATEDQQLLVADLERAMKDNGQIMRENEERKNIIKRMITESNLTQIKYADLDSKFNSMTDKVAAYEKELKSLKITNEHMKYEIADQISKFQALQTERDELLSQLSTSQKTVEELNQQLTTATTELQQTQEKLKELTEEHQSLINQFENYVKFVCNKKRDEE